MGVDFNSGAHEKTREVAEDMVIDMLAVFDDLVGFSKLSRQEKDETKAFIKASLVAKMCYSHGNAKKEALSAVRASGIQKDLKNRLTKDIARISLEKHCAVHGRGEPSPAELKKAGRYVK